MVCQNSHNFKVYIYVSTVSVRCILICNTTLFTVGKADHKELLPLQIGEGSLQSVHPSLCLAFLKNSFRG